MLQNRQKHRRSWQCVRFLQPCSSKHTVDFKNFPKDPVQYARFEKMPQPLYMFVIVVVADLSLNVSVFGSKVQKLAAVTWKYHEDLAKFG